MIDIEVQKAIRKAIKQGDLRSVICLIGDDKSRLTMITTFGSWLHVAADHDQLEIAKWLVTNGIDVNVYGGTRGGAPLNEAASGGHIDIVRYLLNCGAARDVSEPERNPLFGAIYHGHAAIAKLLIDSGIDTQIRYTGENMKDVDAVAFARQHGRNDIVELLEAKSRES